MDDDISVSDIVDDDDDDDNDDDDDDEEDDEEEDEDDDTRGNCIFSMTSRVTNDVSVCHFFHESKGYAPSAASNLN